MLARAARLCSALLVCGLALAGCHKKPGPPPPPHVALVVAGGFGDRSFNDEAQAGLESCKRAVDVIVDTASGNTPHDVESQLVLFATENESPVMTVGPATAPEIESAARRFPGTTFGIVDGVVNEANVVSVTFREEQGAFLAGALAAMVSKTHTVAFLGGIPGPRLTHSESGFAAGVAEVDPHARVLTRYTDSFTKRAAALQGADKLFAAGADIAFVVDGPAGLGAIDAALRHRGTFLIGVDANQDGLAPGHFLTSVVKNIGAATQLICLDAFSQKMSSGHTVLGLADDGVGLTNFAYTKQIIGTARLARLERIRRAIVDGTITAPATAAQLHRFRAVPVR